MPASPVLRDTARDVRIVEVLQELEPEDEAQSDRHVGVPAEVVVDLEGVADRAQPGGHAIQLLDRLRENFVGHSSQGVSDENLLGETHDEAFHTVRHLLEVHRAALKLVGYIVILDDRARHQLREEGYIERKLVDVFLRLDLLPINIHHVADGLKGIEGNANGHDSLDETDMPAEEFIDVLDKEVAIFEVEQKAQVTQNGKEKPDFLFLVLCNEDRSGIVDDDNEQHHQHVTRLSPCIEKDTCQQQNVVPKFPPHQKVQGTDDRQEQEQEC